MKIYEETWAANANDVCTSRVGPDGREVRGEPLGEMNDDAYVANKRARLAATAPQMARLLLRLGLGGGRDGVDRPEETPSCVCCGHDVNGEWRDHAPGCALVAVLTKAGVIDS